jgi:hypothetical protein
MSEPALCSFLSTEECALHFWLRVQRVRHLHLRQEHETFDPPLFRGNVKHPDFLLQLKSAGVLGVDAKSGRDRCAFPTEEIVESSGFERVSGIPVWYAIPAPGDKDNSWSWIRLQKVIDEGVVEGGERIVPLDHFVRITAEADLKNIGRYNPRSPTEAESGPEEFVSIFEGAKPVPRSPVVDASKASPLDSSSISYDPASQTLKVRVSHGGVHEYLHVPESVFGGLMAAESRNDFFATRIKARYRFREQWRHAQV